MSDIPIKFPTCHSNHHVTRVLLDYLTMRKYICLSQGHETRGENTDDYEEMFVQKKFSSFKMIMKK